MSVMTDNDQRSAVVDVLRKARALLVPPGSWTRNALARDEHGHTTPVESEQAVAFCISGALCRIAAGYINVTHYALDALRVEAYHSSYWRSITGWNDAPGRTQQEVLDLFDRTIKAVETQP